MNSPVTLSAPVNTAAKSVLYSWVHMAGTDTSRMISTSTEATWWLKL